MDKYNALMGNPFFQIGAGILSNNTGNYGNLGPALGRGFMQGTQNLQAFQQQQAGADYNRRQQELMDYHYQTDRMKAEQDRKKLAQQQANDKANAKMYLPGFLKASGIQGQGFDIGEDGELVPVGNVMTPASADLKWMGEDGDGYAAMIAQGLQSEDAAVQRRALNEAFRYYREQKKPVRGEKDPLAKERAVAAAMEMSLKDYLRDKGSRAGVNVNVPVYNYGQPKEVTLPSGEAGLVRFDAKNPYAPAVVMEGYGPTASDTEQMTANYTQRMSAAEGIFDELERGKDKGYASWGSKAAGILGEDARTVWMNESQQKRRQAEDDWIRAKLRKESGAVIAQEEMESERRTYFPYPGDSQALIRQKAEARKQAIKGMSKAAGPAMPREHMAKPTQSAGPQQRAPVAGKPGGVKFLGFE